MLVFFDTEFTGLHKNTTLISIGLVSEYGDELYLEFNDYDRDQCDEWVTHNVLDNTISEGDKDVLSIVSNEQDYHFCENKEEAKQILESWFKQFNQVQLVSDCCHYDMVLLIDIFGTAFDLPSNVSPVCYDINQDIAAYEGCSCKEAFDIGRESFIKSYGNPIVGDKHNSLYDARVIKEIYRIILGV